MNREIVTDSLANDLADLAKTVAEEAGKLVHAGRNANLVVAGTKSSPQDVVTEMDLAAEQLLRERLASARPHDAFLGEEGGYTAGGSPITWVIDPIDGTVNYLYGLPGYSVMVAAVTAPAGVEPTPQTWTVVASCIHAPALGHTYTAARAGGAYRNGERLRVRPPAELALSLLATGFGYRAEVRRRQGEIVAQVLPQVRDIRRMGSAGLDLCALAEGSIDLYYEMGLKPWDLAAGALIAAEAGALVTGLHGAPASEQMTVAGNPHTVAPLIALLEEIGADQR